MPRVGPVLLVYWCKRPGQSHMQTRCAWKATGMYARGPKPWNKGAGPTRELWGQAVPCPGPPHLRRHVALHHGHAHGGLLLRRSLLRVERRGVHGLQGRALDADVTREIRTVVDGDTAVPCTAANLYLRSGGGRSIPM